MILSPADIRALEKVCELTQFRKGRPRIFNGERVRGPGGKGFLARKLDVDRNTVISMLKGRRVLDVHGRRASEFAREVMEGMPELFAEAEADEPRIGEYTRSQWIAFAVERLDLRKSRASAAFDFMYERQVQHNIARISAEHSTLSS